MGYLPDTLPLPDGNPDEAGFWANCEARQLTFQCCGDCDTWQHPPTPYCPACGSVNRTWRDAPEIGEVYAFTITHHPAHPSVQGLAPYNVILVDFPELGHLRLISNLVDGNDISIGMKVRLVWDEQGGRTLPRFTKAG